MPRTYRPKIDPNAPANPTQVVVLESNNVQARLREITRAPGRPKLRVDEFADEMIERLCCGESLLSICQDAHMPSYAWAQSLQARDPSFAEIVDRARERGQEAWVDAQYDVMSGGILSTGETQRDRELVNVIRWTAGKRASRRYGDRIVPDGGILIIARPKDDDGLNGLLE
jgi:hypothetical protein